MSILSDYYLKGLAFAAKQRGMELQLLEDGMTFTQSIRWVKDGEEVARKDFRIDVDANTRIWEITQVMKGFNDAEEKKRKEAQELEKALKEQMAYDRHITYKGQYLPAEF